ncbi:AAA family ATPase [Candidatus Babeliales bacterium]|nr:AAA family ATPase [Candidatus Babeliales bacterium]
MQKFLRGFFSITLFLLMCPSIFTKSSEIDHTALNQEEQAAMHEVFQKLMTEAKEQTQAIEFCIQQICQTIAKGKIQITAAQKEAVLTEWSLIKEFTAWISEKILVQNTQEALIQGVLFNSVIINYLIKVLSEDVAKININLLQTALAKRCNAPISDDSFFVLAQQNAEKINILIDKADHLGLTWYNKAYRSLKKNNAYSLVKATGVIAATAMVASIALCMYDQPSNNYWYNKFIGARPEQMRDIPGYYVLERNQDLSPKVDEYGRQVWKFLDTPDQTITQRVITTMGHLREVGLLATSTLLTLNYQSLFAWMYKDTADWAQEKFKSAAHKLDQQLQGIAKTNVNKYGCDNVSIDDMIGCEDLKQLARNLASFMKYPERYERAQIEEHRGILLSGAPQTGKTFFAKVLRTLIEQELGDAEHLRFIDFRYLYDRGLNIDEIFAYASFYAPCIIFIDELDMLGVNREKDRFNTAQLLTCMQGLEKTSKQIIVIAATNKPDQLDNALLVDGRFGKHIHIDLPRYTDRLTFFNRELDKRCINLDPKFIDCMAQETEGSIYNNLNRIINEAILIASTETRAVTQKDFERAIDAEIRHIQYNQSMSEQERRIVAIYQAGKAVARHALETIKEVVKVTIYPVVKNIKTTEAGLVMSSTGQKPGENEKLAGSKAEQFIKLGEVFTKSTTNYSDLLGNSEQEKECLCLCAGNAALKIFFDQYFDQCNKQDRAEAMAIIYNIVGQGEKIDDYIKTEALKLKHEFDERIINILLAHKDLIEKIANKLLEQSTIDRYEWKELIS